MIRVLDRQYHRRRINAPEGYYNPSPDLAVSLVPDIIVKSVLILPDGVPSVSGPS